MTLCASFCWKSLSRPFLYNLDSTPPQVINTATNDGEPGVGGQSPISQDFAPIHHGWEELSAPFRDRPDLTLLQKSEGRPQFLFGIRPIKTPPRGERAALRRRVNLYLWGILSDKYNDFTVK